jgi:hypothetical protein
MAGDVPAAVTPVEASIANAPTLLKSGDGSVDGLSPFYFSCFSKKLTSCKPPC